MQLAFRQVSCPSLSCQRRHQLCPHTPQFPAALRQLDVHVGMVDLATHNMPMPMATALQFEQREQQFQVLLGDAMILQGVPQLGIEAHSATSSRRRGGGMLMVNSTT